MLLGTAIVILAALAGSAAGAFTFPPAAPASSTALFGRAVKRGKLAQNVSPETSVKPGGQKKKKGGKKRSPSQGKAARAGADDGGGGISRSLADWAAGLDDGAAAAEDSAATVPAPADAPPSATSFAPFPDEGGAEDEAPRPRGERRKGGGGGGKRGGASADRRSRQAERRAADAARRSLIRSTLSDLEDMLNPQDGEAKKSKTRDVDAILGKIRTLIENPPTEGGRGGSGIRVLAQGQQMRDFRMAWAGSDDAICHLGTGLHKVPLARLQEVFLTLGKRRVDIVEVIRILGPFPNVRNTLKGDTSIARPKSAEAGEPARLDIVYDSMVDGTGKEILAGTEDNVRRVGLDVLFADEEAMVCAIPAEEGENDDDPLGSGGVRVLLFVKEGDMDAKLDVLRVS